MIPDLTTNGMTNTGQTAAGSSPHAPAHPASAQPLRVWSTPRLIRLAGGTEKIPSIVEFIISGPAGPS